MPRTCYYNSIRVSNIIVSVILIICRFMTNVDDHIPFLPLIVPIIVARLGTQDITEPSEEIR